MGLGFGFGFGFGLGLGLANPNSNSNPNPNPNPHQLRLVWMVREPVGKFWSYFWDLKSYGGEWDRVSFTDFVTPKLARARACQQRDAASPLTLAQTLTLTLTLTIHSPSPSPSPSP